MDSTVPTRQPTPSWPSRPHTCKAHYPAEYMAAVLTSKKNKMDDLGHYLHECNRMKIKVLGPDINESEIDFTVNARGEIRFGLSALKGVGEGPVEELIIEKEKTALLKILEISSNAWVRGLPTRKSSKVVCMVVLLTVLKACTVHNILHHSKSTIPMWSI
ncbi:MAG: hypothetical protein IPG87_18115 [Saprospiraceae bacterium]|nr:hypothetical protein [Candidatus Vicinibacter affinis]